MTESSVLSPQSLLRPSRWLVTGGCGFIGTSLIKSLVSEGVGFIRVLDNLSVGTREDLARVCDFIEIDPSKTQSSVLSPQSLSSSRQSSVLSPQSLSSSPQSPSVELIIGDILDPELALNAGKGMDITVHLAANTGVAQSVEDPKEDMEANVIGTFNMLETARHNGIKRFIFASSGAPIGECAPPIHEELAPHPVSPYGASKLAGEGYCSAYYRSFGVETVALRFSNVYGPGSGHKNSVVAKFIRQAVQGETLEIYGDGKQTRDFIFIDDLIRAIRMAAQAHGIGGEIVQIATNTETTVDELVEKLIPVLADSGHNNIEVRYSTPRLGDVRRNFSDTSKAHRLLGWRAEFELETGLKRTVAAFLSQKP